MNVENIWLDKGSHHNMGPGNGCAMEWAAVKWMMRHGYSWDEAWARMNDQPGCTDPLVRYAVQRINDRLPDDERQRLVPVLDRIERCHTPTDPVKAKRVRVRVSCWAARSVLDLIRDEERRAVALRAIETAEAWLRGEATKEDCASAAAAADAASAAYTYAAADAAAYAAAADAAAYAAAASAAYAAADAAAYAAADAAAAASLRSAQERDLVMWLDELLDQWEKACAEEGVLSDEPPVPAR